MGRVPGAHRLPAGSRTLRVYPPPQTRRAPRPHARRLPAAAHGAAAPAGMTLAEVLDSANAEVPSPASGGGRDGCVASLTPPLCPAPPEGRRCGGRQYSRFLWNPVMTISAFEYMLGEADEECSRLLAQCAALQETSIKLLDQLPIQAGWRALDVGCGPRGILDLLSYRVGPTGRVMGLDYQPRMIESAAHWIGERCLPNVDLICASAEACPLPSNSFDMAHARLLLINVPRPENIVREMARLVRPGGWIAIQERDWLSWVCIPPHPAWETLREHLAATWSGNVHIGRSLSDLLRQAGLTDIHVAAHAQVTQPGDLPHDLLLYFAQRARNQLLNSGRLNSQDYDRLVDELRQHLYQPHCLTLDALLVQAWGRVPV